MGLGKHLVIYQAADEAKNKEKCVFTITVVQFKQEHPGRKYVVFSNLIAGKNVSCVPLFIYPEHICFYRWVLCRVGNTGRQIRLLVPKVIKVQLFFRNLLILF